MRERIIVFYLNYRLGPVEIFLGGVPHEETHYD